MNDDPPSWYVLETRAVMAAVHLRRRLMRLLPPDARYRDMRVNGPGRTGGLVLSATGGPPLGSPLVVTLDWDDGGSIATLDSWELPGVTLSQWDSFVDPIGILEASIRDRTAR